MRASFRAVHLRKSLGAAALSASVLLSGCGDGGAELRDAASAADAPSGQSVRGNRYCEVLVAFLEAGSIEAQVWGTQGLNACPAEAWSTVDAAAIRTELGATAVVLNGPRYWLIDGASAELPAGAPRLFGTLEMQQLATLTIAPGAASPMPYVERVVNRDSVFDFRAGAEVYELVGPDGATYVMQSYAQIVDETLSEADLPGLGARLELPAGWQYRARTLEAPLVVRTAGAAVVVQDELQNTYSRHPVPG